MLARNPLYPGLRNELAQSYLGAAQRNLQAGSEDAYLRNLSTAQRHLLDQVEREPEDAGAHNLLAILSAYRGDLDASRLSFRIAERLDPRDSAPNLNLAEISVYQNQLAEARRWLRRARDRGARPGESTLVEALLAWKQRDLVEARALFRQAKDVEQGEVSTWNGARALETFEDLAAHCCRLSFCGPYMVEACGDMSQAVAQQERAEETLLEELRLQMERTRRVREVYERRRELDIRVDELAEPLDAAEVESAGGTAAGAPPATRGTDTEPGR